MCQIKMDLEHVNLMVEKILQSGVTLGLGDTRIKELKEKLKQVQELIDASESQRLHQLIGQSIDDLRLDCSL